MLTGTCGIRFTVIQIIESIDLEHGFKKANTSIFLLPISFCVAAL